MLLKELAQHADIILTGLGNTLIISVAVILCAIVLASFLTLACLGSHGRFWNGFFKHYLSFVHGIPQLVILMVMYYVIFSSTRLPAIIVAIISFTVYIVPEFTDVFLTSIKNVPEGQYLAGISLGFSQKQTFRHIIFPQAVKSIGAGSISYVTSTIKETSLAGYITVADLTGAVQSVMDQDYNAVVPLLVIAVIYYGICMLFTRIIEYATGLR